MARKTKKRVSGMLTGMILLILLLGVGVQLYRMQERVAAAQAEEAALTEQKEALAAENRVLADAIERADDPEMIEQIAREELGMVVTDEKTFLHIGG